MAAAGWAPHVVVRHGPERGVCAPRGVHCSDAVLVQNIAGRSKAPAVLAFLFFSPRRKLARRGHEVPIEQHSYIPVPPEVLRQKLGQRLEAEAQKEWQATCSALQDLVHEELQELRCSLCDSYQPFDPARRRWVGSWPLPDKEERFARQFLRAASLAGFTPLSRFDLEKTRELKADLLSLPVTINWDRLDSRWIETLLKGAGEEGAEAVPEALSDFGGYVLALKRGLAVERHSGRLLMQKLECLQSQWLLRVGSLLQSLLRGVSRLSVKAWRTVLPAARGWAESRHGEALRRKLRRVKAAGARGVSFAKLLRETWRGVRMRISGMQVLRRLQPSSYRYAQWLFGDVLNERWSTERAALIKRLANAWEQEVALRGQLQSHLPVSAEVRKAAKEQGNFLERVAIEHLSFNWATLLQHAELQEPQFQDRQPQSEAEVPQEWLDADAAKEADERAVELVAKEAQRSHRSFEADDPYASLPRDPYRGGTLFKERRVHGWCYGSDTVKDEAGHTLAVGWPPAGASDKWGGVLSSSPPT
ncbi:unnamed protein product [Durusdinium trenchii]|uniref:Uncharacterized protein n=1 Tax=Durusdinium trenchii TaxID=1381693 RepID=A0ABP0MX07_9DINO